MTQTQQFDADLMATEPEGQVTFTFAGKSYIGQRTPVNGSLVMADTEYELKVDFMMSVRLSQFVSPDVPPADNDTIEMDGQEYNVQVTPDQYGVAATYAVTQST